MCAPSSLYSQFKVSHYFIFRMRSLWLSGHEIRLRIWGLGFEPRHPQATYNSGLPTTTKCSQSWLAFHLARRVLKDFEKCLVYSHSPLKSFLHHYLCLYLVIARKQYMHSLWWVLEWRHMQHSLSIPPPKWLHSWFAPFTQNVPTSTNIQFSIV